MNVIYTAPNRAHHYKYAEALQDGGILSSFVSGFSRFSSLSNLDSVGDKLHRVDILQNVFLASLRMKMPNYISEHLAYLAKIEQDNASSKYIKNADVFMFYNGSGLNTCKKIQKAGGIGIVEAVNSHVQFQEDILKREFEKLNLPWEPFHQKEKARRIEEYHQADYILLPSEFAKRSFMEFGFPESKLIKVPYGFNTNSVLNKGIGSPVDPIIRKENFTVLYVGSISVRKGLRYLIEGFKKLKHPNKKLILVGPVYTPDGLSGVSITSDIVFKGVLKGADLNEVYQSANVFCLPSIEEGFGLVLGEALSFGVPLISTSHTGAFEIMEDGIEGFIIPPQDSESFRDRLQQLADEPELLYKMKMACLTKAASLKGWDETGKLLVSSLLKVKP